MLELVTMTANAIPSPVDVLVAGAGTAGVPASIQAARAGTSVLLVEKGTMPGGTTTAARVQFPGIFHAWGKQVIAGIGWDLVERCVAECGGPLPDFSTPPAAHWQHQVNVQGPVFAALCDEAMQQAGVAVLYHTMLGAVERIDDLWRVTLCTKTGLQTIRTRMLVDCTGDANLAALAGCDLRVPEHAQPATLCCLADGYDFATLDVPAIEEAAVQAVAEGRLQSTDAGWDRGRPRLGGWLSSGGNNANHIHGHQARTSEGRSDLEMAGRAALLRLFRFLRTQPGLEHLRIRGVAAECGVRETATVLGRDTITAEDYVSGRLWPDPVCYAFYPIDLHTSDGKGLDCRQLRPGIVPSVPRGALLPQGTEDLVVAGRCLSSDRLANSALRVQATAMATGQAAGALAALACAQQTTPAAVPAPDLRALLEQNGAIVPGR
jgi:glycine/D-amino acid oxidase-like deaminating enzyme